MRRRSMLKWGIVGSCALVLTIAPVVTAQQSEEPSVDFVAAALLHQEALAGGRLELWCSVVATETDVDEHTVSYTYHYVRTPDLRGIVISRPDSVLRAHYSRTTGELLTMTTKVGTGATRVVRSFGDAQGPLQWGQVIDVPLYHLVGGQSLVQSIAQGGYIVSREEEVDGRLCWRIDMEFSEGPAESSSVWLDPQNGFCPRLLVQLFRAEFGSVTTSFADYHEYDQGIWLPGVVTQTEVYHNPPPGVDAERLEIVRVITVDDAAVGTHVSDQWVPISIPTDATVGMGSQGETTYDFVVEEETKGGQGGTAATASPR